MARKRKPASPKLIEFSPIPRFDVLERAGEFLQAYHDLPSRTLFNWPKYVMLGHAAELMLKAYLLTPTITHPPMTLDELKAFGHDLVALLQAAVARGLVCDGSVTKDIEFLSRAHNNYQARYPLVEITAKRSNARRALGGCSGRAAAKFYCVA